MANKQADREEKQQNLPVKVASLSTSPAYLTLKAKRYWASRTPSSDSESFFGQVSLGRVSFGSFGIFEYAWASRCSLKRKEAKRKRPKDSENVERLLKPGGFRIRYLGSRLRTFVC